MTRRFPVRCLLLLLSALAFPLQLSADETPPALPTPALPDGLGVNIHFTDPRPGEMKMLADAGVTWVRMDFTWGATERVKGEYDFSAYDRLMTALDEHKLRALFILDYGNPLYDGGLSPHTDEGRAAMARWAAAAAAHFRSRGVIWEMWNEPNIKQFWKPQPNVEDYTKLAATVGEALRAADPHALYVGPATSQIDMPFLEGCFKAGLLEHWTAVTVHPYRQKDPETAAEEYRGLRELIARHAPKGKPIPILSGEWGYSAAWKHYDEDRQGKLLPRQWLTNISNDVPLSIWYDWHDDGPDPHEAEHHFGTVRFPYHDGRDPVYDPKPAYLAARTLTTFLRGFRFNKRPTVGDAQDHVLLFHKPGTDDVRLVVWTTANEPRDLTVPASPGAFTGVDHLGKPLPGLTAGADGLRVKATSAPQYLVPQEKNELLRVGAAWERLPLEVRQPPAAAVRLHTRFTNPLDRPLTVTMNGLRFTAPPGAPMVLAASVELPHDGRPAPVRLTWEVEGLGALAQETHVLIDHPLQVVPLPADGRTLAVRVENPTGRPFEGTLTLQDLDPPQPGGPPAVAVVLGAEETRKIVQLPLAADPGKGYGFRVRLEEKSGAVPALLLPPMRYRVLDTFPADAAEGAYDLVPGGDADVRSDSRIARADPPDGRASPGLGSLRLTYRFEQGWKYLQLIPRQDERKAVDGKPRELGIWVWGDGQGNIPRMRFVDSTGQTFQPTAESITWKGWRYVRFKLDTTAGHWGGAADGVIHYPIRIDTLFLLDGVDGRTTAGEIYLAGPTLVY